MTEPTFRTIIEPFRIHSVEPLRMTSRAERQAAVAKAGYNLFQVDAELAHQVATQAGDDARLPGQPGVEVTGRRP
jgi:tryptophanase